MTTLDYSSDGWIHVSQETAPAASQEVTPQATVDATSVEEGQLSKQKASQFLTQIQEKAGQIYETEMEEENLVREFFDSLLQILRPFSKTIEISVSSLPESYSERTNKAHLHLTGELVLVYKDGELEILNLREKENRQLLIDITGEIMEKLQSIIDLYKAKTERRVKFLLPITQQLQSIAKVFSESLSQKR